MSKKTTVLLAALATAACSTAGTSIRVGERVYPPTPPGTVTLLVAPPERRHEIIALVEGVAATDDYFTRERTQAAAIEALRKEAARIGAHAVVLTGKGSTPYGSVTVGGAHGSAIASGNVITGYMTITSTTMGWEKITISGNAIRYLEPAP